EPLHPQWRRPTKVVFVVDADLSTIRWTLGDSPASGGACGVRSGAHSSVADSTFDDSARHHVLHEWLLQSARTRVARWFGHVLCRQQSKLGPLLAELFAAAG